MICVLGFPSSALYSVSVILGCVVVCILNPERVTTWSQTQQKVLQVLLGSVLKTLLVLFLLVLLSKFSVFPFLVS